MLNLSTDLLRTFVEIVESGSMLRASERVCVTPSAVSLQVKRLEDMCRAPLFFRDGRKLNLTPAGELLVDYARDILRTNDDAVEALAGERAVGAIRIGLVEDFARTLLASTLRRFAALNPEAQIHLRVCGSQQQRDLIAANRLDIALFISPAEGEEVVTRRNPRWFGNAALAEREIVPLALLEKPCLFREHALQTLIAAGIKYEIVAETASVSALQAVVEAGLGITPRLPWRMQDEMPITSLPQLPQVGFTIATLSAPDKAIKTLRNVLAASLADL